MKYLGSSRQYRFRPLVKGNEDSGNKEYKGRNRHNVECLFEGVLYFGWPNQPSSSTMEHFASGRVFYVAYYRKYFKNN